MKPLATFSVTFALALVLTGVTAARTRTFQSANCNAAAPQPTASMTRDGQMNYAIIAAWDGYQWGGGCWNNDDHDAAPNDPPQQYTGGEGGDCSGFTFKVWWESLDTNDKSRFLWQRKTFVHGPYNAHAFHYGYGAPNVAYPKGGLIRMDALASDWHIGIIYAVNANGTDQIVEAKGEAYGTKIWTRTYRSNPNYGGVRRLLWNA